MSPRQSSTPPRESHRFLCACSSYRDDPGMVVCWRCSQSVVDVQDVPQRAIRALLYGGAGEEWPLWMGHLPWDVRAVYERLLTAARREYAETAEDDQR